MSKRIKRISKAMDSALIKACKSFGPEQVDSAGGFTSSTKRVSASELRDVFAIWREFERIKKNDERTAAGK